MTFPQKVRHILKTKFDLIRNENLKKNLLNAIPFWAGAALCGVVSVFYAKLFALAEMAGHRIFLQTNWAFFIITPASFVLAWWVVARFAPYARGSGIPQVTAAIELSNPKHAYKVNALLNFKIILLKVASSLVMVFGGGIIGREGPTIQICASIFKKINDFLPDWYPKISRRNMIVTGGAAGLAAAFNTPLGGIVFAIEELTKTHFSFFKSALLSGVIIAGLTALYFLGPYLYLGYPDLSGILSAGIILLTIPVSIIAGLAGSGMGSIALSLLKFKKRLKNNFQHILYAALCGLAIAALAVFVDGKVLGSGKEIMVDTLFTGEKHAEWYLPLLRIFGSITSFSTGASGGIFAPSLSAGASIGSVFSGWFQMSDTESNLLILCGMAGFLTGITRSPFTSSILVLEMTNSHNVILYIMLTALFSNLVASLISRHSFYDHLKTDYIREIHGNEAQYPPGTNAPKENSGEGTL